MSTKRRLDQIPFLAGAPAGLRQEVSEAAVPIRLQQGTVFFTEGDLVSQFVVVRSGRIRVFKLAESGRAITLYHVHPGEACLLNMSCLLAGLRCSASAEAEIDICEASIKEYMGAHTRATGRVGNHTYSVTWPMRHYKATPEKYVPAKPERSTRQGNLTLKEM